MKKWKMREEISTLEDQNRDLKKITGYGELPFETCAKQRDDLATRLHFCELEKDRLARNVEILRDVLSGAVDGTAGSYALWSVKAKAALAATVNQE